jgi:hypothetical protein
LKSSQRKGKAKVEAFEEFEISPKSGKKGVHKLRRSTAAVGSTERRRSGPLVYTSRRSSGGAYRRRRLTAVGSSLASRIPSAVGSGGDDQSLVSGAAQARRTDLSRQILSSGYPSAVRLEVVRELHEVYLHGKEEEKSRQEVKPSGYWHSRNRDSRGRVNRDITSLETPREIWTVHLRGHVAAIECHRGKLDRRASSENRDSEFHESREQLHQTSRNRETRFPDNWRIAWGHRGVSEEDRWHPISGIGISRIP